MSPDALATQLHADVAAGLRPVLVCPTIGTTGTGAVDPVRAVATLAREHGAWVHVDAAWAGVAALCPEHRDLLDGVELADSFCTDAHKWLLTAFDASLLWVRDARPCPPRCRSPRSTCATPRATRARWSTTATGRSPWAAASGR